MHILLVLHQSLIDRVRQRRRRTSWLLAIAILLVVLHRWHIRWVTHVHALRVGSKLWHLLHAIRHHWHELWHHHLIHLLREHHLRVHLIHVHRGLRELHWLLYGRCLVMPCLVLVVLN